jgi:hypothetical protein
MGFGDAKPESMPIFEAHGASEGRTIANPPVINAKAYGAISQATSLINHLVKIEGSIDASGS